MKDNDSENNCDSHNKNSQPQTTSNIIALSSAAVSASDASATIQNADAADDSVDASALAAARSLLPRSMRHRKFRAGSFAASLNDEQRARVTAWLLGDLSVEQIRAKIALPPPKGFGLQVSATTLDRLRAITKNINACQWVNDAMETAEDLLDSDAAAALSPLRESLALMLYSRALRAAEQQADSAELERLVSTIAKLEKTRSHAVHDASARVGTRVPVTRHHVELTVSPANPKNVTITADRCPESVGEHC